MTWSSLELKIPPVLVVIAVGLIMRLSMGVLPEISLPRPFEVAAALLLATVGALIALLGVLTFKRSHTTVNPLRPEAASALVTRGIYRTTRNPMYLGMLCFLFAWGLFQSQPASLLATPLYVFYMTRFQIVPEERALRMAFGPQFEEYTERVRRWI